MVQAHPSQKIQIANPSNHLPSSDTSVCLLVRDRLVSLLATMMVIIVRNGGVPDMLSEHRGRNLGSVRRILVGE